MIYRELVLHLSRSSHQEQIARVFESAASYARSVVIYGDLDVPDGVDKWVSIGLNIYFELQKLESYELDNTWLAPNLKSTISLLVFSPAGQRPGLSHSLIALGSRLQRLEVLDWHPLLHHKNLFFQQRHT